VKLSASIDRPGLRLVLDVDGPADLVAALAALVARWEGGEVSTAPEAPDPGTSAAKLAAAARARRYRARRHADGVTERDERHAEIVTERDERHAEIVTERDASRVGLARASASRSGSSSDLPGSCLSSDSESENARTGAERDASRVTGERDASRVTGVTAASPLAVASTPAPWAQGVVDTLRMTLGPPSRPVELAAEWVGFVAHIGGLREAGSPRAICEAEWMKWLRRTWLLAREAAEADRGRRGARTGGRIIQAPLAEQADRFDFSEEANERRRVEREQRKAGS
jgi:hypothetical protein